MLADQLHQVTSAKNVLLRYIPSERPLIISVRNAGHMSSGSIQTQAINEESQWLLQTTKPEVDTLKRSMKAEVLSAVYITLSSWHEASNMKINLIYQLVDLEGKEYTCQ